MDAVGGGGSVLETDTFGWIGEVADILVMAGQQYPSVFSGFHSGDEVESGEHDAQYEAGERDYGEVVRLLPL